MSYLRTKALRPYSYHAVGPSCVLRANGLKGPEAKVAGYLEIIMG